MAIKETNKDDEGALGKLTLEREEHLQRVSNTRARLSRRTLSDLPNELILLIFNFAELRMDGLRRLLLVSKRLRRLALSSPRLWARQELDPSMSPYTIDAIARWSRGLGLQASFPSIPESNHAIYRNCESWTDLHLDASYEAHIMRFQSAVPCTRLARLESMTVRGYYLRVLLLNSLWSLPSLKTLNCVFVMPLRVQAPLLSECSLKYNDLLRINQLAHSLSAFPCLERLTINLCQVWDEDDAKDTSLEATLPALKYFTLIADHVNGDFAPRLLDTIRFPNIEYFESDVSATQVPGDDGITVRFGTLIRGMRNRYPSLEAAYLKACCSRIDEGDEIGVVILTDILKELPSSVKNLKLSFDDIELQVCDHLVPGLGPWGSLQWIGFADCNQLAPMFFVDLALLIESYRVKKMTVFISHCIVECDEDTKYSDRDWEAEGYKTDQIADLSLEGFIEREGFELKQMK